MTDVPLISPSHQSPPPPVGPRLSKTTFITYVALLTILSLSVPFFSIPLFAVTVLTLAATGRLKSTVNTVKSIAKETFGHKSELQVEEKQGLLTDFQTTIDTYTTRLLVDCSPKNAASKTIANKELENNFQDVRSNPILLDPTDPTSSVWGIFHKDVIRGAVFEIEGMVKATRGDPKSAFAAIRDFCGGDETKAQTLTLLLQQGELAPINIQIVLSGLGLQTFYDSGFFAKLKKKEGGKIQIQLWAATSIGSINDPHTLETTPRPIWGCVQLTVSEADLATKTFKSAERKVFYLPREPFGADLERDEFGRIQGEKALPLLNAQIAEQRLEL